MNRTILLAVDAARHAGGRHLPAAAAETRDLSRTTGDRVVVLHVHEFADGRFGRLQLDCAEAEKVVDEIVSDLRLAGVTADARISSTDYGDVARVILAVAEESDARMIVLGSTSHTDLPHLPFGSVSTRLLHLARRPVLIVPGQKEALASAPEQEIAAVAIA
jgi:nucleotide-binding universal stress UspA family protein